MDINKALPTPKPVNRCIKWFASIMGWIYFLGGIAVTIVQSERYHQINKGLYPKLAIYGIVYPFFMIVIFGCGVFGSNMLADIITSYDLQTTDIDKINRLNKYHNWTHILRIIIFGITIGGSGLFVLSQEGYFNYHYSFDLPVPLFDNIVIIAIIGVTVACFGAGLKLILFLCRSFVKCLTVEEDLDNSIDKV